MKKFSIFLITLIFIGCTATSTNQGVVGISRKQMFLVGAKQMQAGAAKYYAQVLRQASSKNRLNTNPILTKRIRNISSRLIRQVGVFRQDALKWNWQVNVINEQTVNAWCMPGGKIAVYSGIINKLKTNDAQLAAIIGHEMAHALREHSRERASEEQLKNLGLAAISIATGNDSLANLANTVAQVTFMLPFSRKHETEADTIGTELMARAGYNPNEAVKLWHKMDQIGGNKPPEFLSTHPSNASRIANLEEISKKVMPLYLATK